MTREEIIEAIQHDNTMPFLQDWEARDVVDFVLKNIHPSLPEGLEEAAAQYARDYTENDEGNGGDDWEDDIRITFIAGAKWQAVQDKETIELAEEHAYFAGSVNEREKMLKEAVEGKVYDFRRIKEIGYSSAKIEFEEIPELDDGDKVRIIVIPKEDEK